jgi:hypothetical protein
LFIINISSLSSLSQRLRDEMFAMLSDDGDVDDDEEEAL